MARTRKPQGKGKGKGKGTGRRKGAGRGLAAGGRSERAKHARNGGAKERRTASKRGRDARGERQTAGGRHGDAADGGAGWLSRHGTAVWVEPEPTAPPLLVRDGSADGIDSGHAVSFAVTSPPTAQRASEVTVLEDLGPPEADGTRLQMATAALGLPARFPEDVLEQAEALPQVDAEKPDDHRRDLRDQVHVTIDGDDAKDFDDAISAEVEKGGYRIWISIADVATYVKGRTPLDREARRRGTSVYLPSQVIPMLPERLSNGLCSLVPGEPRYTLTCEMHVAANGARSDIRIYPSLICSAARLTYRQVQKQIDSGNGVPRRVSAVVVDMIAASQLLRKRRFARGSLDLDIPEAEVVFGNGGEVKNVVARSQQAAHQVIEDLMVAANESVAEHLLGHGLAGIYRVHPPPPDDKWRRLETWAKQYGFLRTAKGKRTPQVVSRFLAKFKQTRQAEAGQMMLLRSLSQAHYSSECAMHFGLASDAYAHFTSPIRRYPDLIVHRALWQSWAGKSSLRGLTTVADSSSELERRAVDAEREVTRLAGCLAARQRVGEEMKARVVGVHSAGLFVRPDALFAEGLLPVKQLGRHDGEFFEVWEDAQMLVGRNSRQSYTIGDAITVRLAEVDVDRRRINFELADTSASGRGSRGRRKPQRTAVPGSAARRKSSKSPRGKKR